MSETQSPTTANRPSATREQEDTLIARRVDVGQSVLAPNGTVVVFGQPGDPYVIDRDGTVTVTSFVALDGPAPAAAR